MTAKADGKKKGTGKKKPFWKKGGLQKKIKAAKRSASAASSPSLPEVMNKMEKSIQKAQKMYDNLWYFNAATRSSAIAFPECQGKFLPVPGLTNITVMTDDALDIVYVIAHMSATGLRLAAFSAQDRTLRNFGWLQLIADAQPPYLRPMALTLRIRNTTAQNFVSGTVRVLNHSEVVPITFDAGDATVTSAFINYCNDVFSTDFNVKTYSGSELLDTREISTYPTRLLQAQEYATFGLTGNPEQRASALKEERGFSTLLLQFPVSPYVNSYELTCFGQDAARFRPGTLYNALEKPGPTVNKDYFQKQINLFRNNGSNLKVVS